MREIKFRGVKLDSEEWVYGYYFEQKMLYGDHSMIIANTEEPNDWDDKEQRYFHVKRETIGQYVGLKDINQKEIYEGDITCNHTVILFNELKSMFCEYYYNPFTKKYSLSGFPLIASFEVKGNIHENPNILTQHKN